MMLPSCFGSNGAERAVRAAAFTILGALGALSASAQSANVAVNAAQSVRTVDERVFGLNAVMWDADVADPQTISLVGAAGVRVIRIPGGSLSDTYHWTLNKGVDTNNVLNNFSWASGTDSFVKLISGINSQAFVTVNYGTGTPEEAAAWVAYCNAPDGLLGTGSDVTIGSDGTTDWKTAGYWSHLRASSALGTDDGFNFLRLGRSAPFGLKDWEIGNECYGTWEEDFQAVAHDPYTYAKRAKSYIAKMKAVDSTIKVGVVVETGQDTYVNNTSHPATNPNGGGVHNGWTPVLLTTLKSIGAAPDFAIYHRYEQTPLHDTTLANAESDSGLLQKAKTWPNDAADLRQQITDYYGSGVELVVTENNSVYAEPGKQSTSLVNGLYLADSIGNIMQTEFNSLVWWDLRNGQDNTQNNSASLYGWRMYGDYGVLSTPSSFGSTTYFDPYPTYYVMKLLSNFARGGDTVIKTTSDNTLLSAFSVLHSDGSARVMLINKDPTNTITANIALSGFTPGTSATVYSYGKVQDNAAMPGGSGSPDVATSSASVAGTSFSFATSPYSVTVLSIPSQSTVITAQPAAHAADSGGATTFSVTAGGTGPFTYQWQRLPAGSGTWADLSDSGVFSGTATATLSLSTVTYGMNGDQFRVLVTNAQGSSTSSAATLTVNAVTNAISYDATTFPASAGIGTSITFTTDVTNLGSNAWGAQHYLVLRDPDGNNLSFASLTGVAPGGSTTATLSFTAPATPGPYTYYIQGLENNVAWFSARKTVTLAVGLTASGIDFNSDGKADLLWTNTTTGDRAIWFMDGTAVGSFGYLAGIDPA
ncbi:MAG TPA: hypothetical protein VGM73_04850, partial [Candidatus Didemnitutus sp.]